uniref:Death domain-containing protein n=1 Tax=Caenorhabditis tropicalis TaxID=1561998 RepID=A0A1I7UZG4_9PELO
MTGAPPTRMAGAPPSKRLLKRPTPPPPSSTQQKRDPSPPKEIQKKKTSIPEDSSSQGTDIICIDDEEPPAKKQKEDGPPVLTPEGSLKEKSTSEASTSSEVVKKSPPTSTAILAKKIIKQHEDASKANGTSTPPKEKGMGAILATLFESLKKKGAEFQEKKMTEFDDDTLMEISRFLDVIKAQKQEKINMEPLIYTIASSFGMKSKDVIDQVERGVLTRKDPLDWKLTQADLPFMSEQEIANMTTMVKSWKSKKELTNAVLTAWLKDVNQGRMTLDQARKKFFEVINLMPDLEKQQDTVIELPKHERSRKARMFLHQWIFLSREYIADLIPQLRKKTPSTVSLAQKQVAAVNVMREQVKKQIGLHEQKKERNGEDIPFVFMFTDPVQAAIGPYLEELLEYSLSIKSLVTIISGIDSLHQAVKDHITLIQFYVEIVRRHQKLSFMAVEEPMKTMFNEAKENIYKIQVVQNPKYQIVWPDGEEPSMRHMTKEIHEFQVSILKKPPKKSTSTPLRPSTSSPATAPKPPVITLEDPKHQQAVNQLVQMYLGKYLLSSTGGTTVSC